MRAARFETLSSNKLYQKAFALFRTPKIELVCPVVLVVSVNGQSSCKLTHTALLIEIYTDLSLSVMTRIPLLGQFGEEWIKKDGDKSWNTKDDINEHGQKTGMNLMVSKCDDDGLTVNNIQKMAPFTKMTEMTPDNVVDYVASFAAEVKWWWRWRWW